MVVVAVVFDEMILLGSAGGGRVAVVKRRSGCGSFVV